jgi:membrane protein
MELAPLRDRWPATFKSAGKRFPGNDCTGLAQEVAYSSLLAFFPAVVALVGLLDLLHAYGALDSFLSPVAPHAVTALVHTFQADSGSGSGVALAIGLLGAIWAASGAMGTVVKSINRAYGCEETRPLWKKRLVAIVLVLATAIVTVGTMVVIVFGGTLGDAVARRAGLGSAFRWAWGIARWPLGLVLVLLLLALIYELGPSRKRRGWRWLTPGSLLGALLWLALSGALAAYTGFSNSYSRTYGALAGGIILLLWLNFSAWAILFGAELNAEVERQARSRAELGAEPAAELRDDRAAQA